MVIRTDEKYKIKFDEEEEQYIYYRIMNKTELTAHKNEAQRQLASVTNAIEQFQTYIDDERVVNNEEPKEA